MSTSLYVICKSGIKGKTNFEFAQSVLPKLKALNIKSSLNHDGTIDTSDWQIHIEEHYKQDNEIEDVINIHTPTPYCTINIYHNCITISTIYRYSILYELQKIDWFPEFRNDIFNIIQLFGADEIIYLADNGNELSDFLDDIVCEHISYSAVKIAMKKKFGAPVTDYKKLNQNTFEYNKMKEFVLDNFKDLKV